MVAPIREKKFLQNNQFPAAAGPVVAYPVTPVQHVAAFSREVFVTFILHTSLLFATTSSRSMVH